LKVRAIQFWPLQSESTIEYQAFECLRF
jgi:hypothetical protein